MMGCMKLHELRSMITETWDDYWNVILEGPLYNYNLGNSGETATVAGWHSGRAVLMDDVDVAIEWGMPTSMFDREWKPEWSAFPDPVAHPEYCDILYRGSLVDRVEVASIDGGRAVLPIPTRRDDEWIAMDWPYHVARLVDSFSSGREFETYFERSGIRKWPA